MRAALLALALLPAACVGPRAVDTRPTYTRASLANRTTAELAATFLPGVAIADIEAHAIREPVWPGGSLTSLGFAGRPRLRGADICEREMYNVSFYPVVQENEVTRTQDMPSRAEPAWHGTRIATASNCALPRGQRYFALVGGRHVGQGPGLTTEEGIAILRQLIAARAAAAGTAPLPFRVRCSTTGDGLNRASYFCPPDARALLAGLAVERAITIDRAPFMPQALCGSPRPETGDSIEVTDEGENPQWVWEVRLHDMGTDRAEIVLTQQRPRHGMAC